MDSNALQLADLIVQAWERSDVTFDKPHQIQLAIIAAKFVLVGTATKQPEKEPTA